MAYLQDNGKFSSFLWEILSIYAIDIELANQPANGLSDVELEQAIVDFRLQKQLTSPEIFREWLDSKEKTYAEFRQQMQRDLQMQQLQQLVSVPKLQEYFIEQKITLDRVVLSRIVLESKEQATELKSQISEDGQRFEQIAQEYSISEDSIVNGMMGAVSRGGMPDELRSAIDAAAVGELIGPIEFDDLFYLLRVEKLLPASLDDEALQQRLQAELFDRWLDAKIQNMQVRLEIDPEEQA